MVTLKGIALIAEIIAAALLVIALVGFRVRRTAPWLICAVVACAMLLTSVAVIIGASST
jgi:hypothetical protein